MVNARNYSLQYNPNSTILPALIVCVNTFPDR